MTFALHCQLWVPFEASLHNTVSGSDEHMLLWLLLTIFIGLLPLATNDTQTVASQASWVCVIAAS